MGKIQEAEEKLLFKDVEDTDRAKRLAALAADSVIQDAERRTRERKRRKHAAAAAKAAKRRGDRDAWERWATAQLQWEQLLQPNDMPPRVANAWADTENACTMLAVAAAHMADGMVLRKTQNAPTPEPKSVEDVVGGRWLPRSSATAPVAHRRGRDHQRWVTAPHLAAGCTAHGARFLQGHGAKKVDLSRFDFRAAWAMHAPSGPASHVFVDGALQPTVPVYEDYDNYEREQAWENEAPETSKGQGGGSFQVEWSMGWGGQPNGRSEPMDERER